MIFLCLQLKGTYIYTIKTCVCVCVCVCVCGCVCPELKEKIRRARELKICIQGYFLTATTVYWFLKRNFGIFTSLDRYLKYNSYSFHLINLKFNQYLEYIGTHLCTKYGTITSSYDSHFNIRLAWLTGMHLITRYSLFT